MKPALLDTGVIVALLDRSERHHRACVSAIESLERALVTCEAVLAESCYLLRVCPGAGAAVLENVERGFFQVPFQLSRRAGAVRRLLRKYQDMAADFADVCLIDLAEQIGSGDILTLDRDFQTYRWQKNQPFHPLLDLAP